MRPSTRTTMEHESLPVPEPQHSQTVSDNRDQSAISAEEMVEAKSVSDMKQHVPEDDLFRLHEELDYEVRSAFEQYQPIESSEQEMDTASETSESVTLDLESKDTDSFGELKLLEEIKLEHHLTRPVQIESTPPRGRKAKRSRRRRGISLERVISQTILQTASTGASDAHFMIETDESQDSASVTAEFILSDLVQYSDEESHFGSAMSGSCGSATTCTEEASPDSDVQPQDLASAATESFDDVLEVFTDDDLENLTQAVATCAVVKQSSKESDQPEPTERPMPVSVESFDTLSWKDVANPGAESQDEQDRRASCESPEIAQEEPETNEIPKETFEEPSEIRKEASKQNSKIVIEQQATNKEEALFKTNFDEWSVFEAPSFEEFEPIPFLSAAADENGFPVTPPQEKTKLPKLKPSSLDARTPLRKVVIRHPSSPATVVDFGNNDVVRRVPPAQAFHFSTRVLEQRHSDLASF